MKKSKSKFVGEVLSIWDFLLTPMYMLIIYIIAYRIKAKQIIKHPEYKYFVWGLTFKIFGGIAFALVYVFWYDGGDTHTYFIDSRALVNMLFYKPNIALSVLTDNLTPQNFSYFNAETGVPHNYTWKDNNTFTIARYTTFFCILGAKSYIPTTILTAIFSYFGVWKLFQLFTKLYPEHFKVLAITILFLPSFIFWGSGIMKDTYIIGATCWITHNFYQLTVVRKKTALNIFLFVLNFIIILNIKPYVIGCLIPAMVVWINQTYIRKIKSALFKALFLPFILIGFIAGGVYLFSNVSKSMGDYGSLDTAIERAKITQEDLLREEQYGGNSYNLGEIDGSLFGLAKMAPLAIFTTLYRPFITEVNNVLMLLSGIENLLLLLFTILTFMQVSPKKTFIIIKQNPLIMYSLVFSIMLAFGVGIATANFGALVRYKIPLIPFYFSSLFLIYHMAKVDKNK